MDSVLVAFDGSAQSLDALGYAIETFPDADITVLHVIDEEYVRNPYVEAMIGGEELQERAHEQAEDVLADAVAAAEEAGVEVDTEIRIGNPVSTILDYAGGHGIDQIVMGGQGVSSIPRILIGSVSFRVVLHADVPVTVVR